MSNERYWPLDAANEQNRIAEVAAAAKLPLIGIVDEQLGGVIGYVIQQQADTIIDALNAAEAASDALDDGWEIKLDHQPLTNRYYVELSGGSGPNIERDDEYLVPALVLALLAAGYGQPE